MKIRKWVTYVRVICLGIGFLFFCPAVALTADLKYIRIGEHKDYTRIVFEFGDTVSFKKPEVKGDGEIAVVFENTQTTLPEKIVSETAKWVKTIAFSRQKSDLVAHITLIFPHVEANAFALSKPERVVIDVKRAPPPPKESILKESLGKDVPRETKTPVPLKKKAIEGKSGDEKAKTAEAPEKEPEPVSKPVPPEQTKRPEILPDTPPVLLEDEGKALDAEPTSDVSPGAMPSPAMGPPSDLTPEPEPEQQVAPVVSDPPIQPAVTTPAENVSPPWLHRENRLVIYLLGTLVCLSVVIIGLLLYNTFRKKRGPAVAHDSDDVNDAFDRLIDLENSVDVSGDEEVFWDDDPGDLDRSIAAIDAKIRNALNEIEKA